MATKGDAIAPATSAITPIFSRFVFWTRRAKAAAEERQLTPESTLATALEKSTSCAAAVVGIWTPRGRTPLTANRYRPPRANRLPARNARVAEATLGHRGLRSTCIVSVIPVSPELGAHNDFGRSPARSGPKGRRASGAAASWAAHSRSLDRFRVVSSCERGAQFGRRAAGLKPFPELAEEAFESGRNDEQERAGPFGRFERMSSAARNEHERTG